MTTLYPALTRKKRSKRHTAVNVLCCLMIFFYPVQTYIYANSKASYYSTYAFIEQSNEFLFAIRKIRDRVYIYRDFLLFEQNISI